MICLERLDARALQLPFEIIPSLELSKGMLSTMCTGLVFLLPYLLSMCALILVTILLTTLHVFGSRNRGPASRN